MQVPPYDGQIWYLFCWNQIGHVEKITRKIFKWIPTTNKYLKHVSTPPAFGVC